MTQPLQTHDWQAYCEQELALINPILARLGYALEEAQVHIGGERSVISGNKLVLLGYRLSDKKRVVVKASSHPQGKQEIQHARTCRVLLNDIHFAHKLFLSPEELLWHEESDCLISISEFIEQERSFLERSFEEQFFLALKTFELQESAHATTYEHAHMIGNTFGIWTTATYLQKFREYKEETGNRLTKAEEVLQTHQERITQYLGFLTHTDFVPHNIRVVGREIYLLDHSAIRFGNKYDGWARFLNFMLLYHRPLEQALVTYVKENRTPEESEALRLMRVFRLGELIWYYVRRLKKTTGHLHELDAARVSFWTDALEALLAEEELPDARIHAYQTLRDTLRSEEEKQRQRGLH
jgi:hypothetical protein